MVEWETSTHTWFGGACSGGRVIDDCGSDFGDDLGGNTRHHPRTRIDSRSSRSECNPYNKQDETK